MFVVADGLGGRREGEKASALAIEALAQYVLNTMPWFLRLQGTHEDDLKAELASAMAQCQERIEAASSASSEQFGMGTTLTMAYITWPRLYVVHVGACRCYLLRNGKLEQITRDQTEAQLLVDHGEMTPAQAHASRWSHVLWDYLGGGTPELSPAVYKAELALSDTLLLCTDGLTKCLRDEEIREILGRNQSAEETCMLLVDNANSYGSPDNITVIVARFLDTGWQVSRARAAAARAEPATKGADDLQPVS
jgi:protein phosphatase